MLDFLLETIFAKAESERKRKPRGDVDPQPVRSSHRLLLSLLPVFSTSTLAAENENFILGLYQQSMHRSFYTWRMAWHIYGG